jgi:hypothetical protein
MTKIPSFSIKLLENSYKKKLKEEGLWKPDCPVPLERLRDVHITHYDFEGDIQKGSMIVLDAVAPFVMTIFKELFETGFPLNKVVSIDHYGGSDDASMEENNSSSFNYRPIAGKNILSIHSYGLAIDINPVQNPYMGNSFINKEKQCGAIEVWPIKGLMYLNRRNQRPGMVEPIIDIFHKYGFRDWGGNWDEMLDYHHFQTPRFLAELLVVMTPDDADDFFEWYVENPQVALDPETIVERYKRDPVGFMKQHPRS